MLRSSRLRFPSENMYELPAKIKLSEEVLFQEIEGECVLLNLTTETYFGLNEVATRFWTLLAEDDSPVNAERKLLSEYRIDAETLKKDLSSLINELNELGLITVEN